MFEKAFLVLKGSIFKSFPLKLAPYDFNHLAFGNPNKIPAPKLQIMYILLFKKWPPINPTRGIDSTWGLKKTLLSPPPK